jgi:hypothetical protein
VVADASARIPDGLVALCDDEYVPMAACGAAGNAQALGDASPCVDPMAFNFACCELTRSAVEPSLRFLRARLKVAVIAFDIAEMWTTPDKVICANVTAVGGGGAGTNAPSPSFAWLKFMKFLFDKLDKMVTFALDKRAGCLKTDAEIELDVLQCNARVEYVLSEEEGGRNGEVRDLIERRVTALESADSSADTADINDLLDDPDSTFGDLCAAYQELMLNTSSSQAQPSAGAGSGPSEASAARAPLLAVPLARAGAD